MQPVFATSFQEAVLAGKWQDALNLLPELVSGEAAQKEAHFLILRQKYNEVRQPSRRSEGESKACVWLFWLRGERAAPREGFRGIWAKG